MNKVKKLQQILLIWKPVYGGGTQEPRQIFFVWKKKKKRKKELKYLLLLSKYRCSVKFGHLNFLHTYEYLFC